MPEPTEVTLTVPLRLPLSLVNAIEAESQRSRTSIPEMLSCMLVDAFDRQDSALDDDAALTAILSNGNLAAHPSSDVLTVNPPAP